MQKPLLFASAVGLRGQLRSPSVHISRSWDVLHGYLELRCMIYR